MISSPAKRLIILLTSIAILVGGPACRRASERAPKIDGASTAAPYEHCARLKTAGPSWKIAGQSASWIFGALADTKEASPATLKHIARFADYLVARQAAAVIILGGLDQRYEGLVEILRCFRGKLPVIGLPGDRESRTGWQAAMRELGSGAVDLTVTSAVQLPGLSLVGVPGYFRPHHLSAKEQGCSYDEQDISALARFARTLPQPRLLLSHGPPAAEGATAIDRAFGQLNIGDPLLRRLLRDGEFRFGLFAHVQESSGRAQLLDGSPASPEKNYDSLLLNVGSADSVAHEDLQGKSSTGDAAVIEIGGGRARFEFLPLAALPGGKDRGVGRQENNNGQ